MAATPTVSAVKTVAIANSVKVSAVTKFYEYLGEVHGKGVCKCTGGQVYDGEYKDDKKHGHGVLKWANGDVYDGEWKDGNQNGHGVLKWADGRVYDCEYKDDKCSKLTNV